MLHKSLGYFVAVSLLFISLAISPAIAETRVVPADYADLQSAIDASVNGDVVLIASGTYAPNATIELMGKAITIRGGVDADGNPASIISGSGSRRVMRCSPTGMLPVTIENCIIQEGVANLGAGIHISGARVTLMNCWVRSNLATGSSVPRGGGILAENSSLDLVRCHVLSNMTVTIGNGGSGYGLNAFGGGVCVSQTPISLDHCLFSDNVVRATSWCNGGALCEDSGALVTVRDSIFQRNRAEGVAMYGRSSGGALSVAAIAGSEISNCTFESNSADGSGDGTSHAGAVYAGSGVIVRNCKFANNHAQFTAGALEGSCIVSKCEFIGNSASAFHHPFGYVGGGGAVAGGGSYTDCQFTSNNGGLYGGAVFASQTLLRRCTFIGNTGGSGGGIAAMGGQVTIDRCWISENSSTAMYEAGSFARGGGGIYLRGGTVAIIDTCVCANTSLTGGQISYAGATVSETRICVNEICQLCDPDGDRVQNPLDNCESVANPVQEDCDNNGVGDACQSGYSDCDDDGMPDYCGMSPGDCDNNGIPDTCDVANGARDINRNWMPDSCECIADLFVDHQVNGADLGALLSQWGIAGAGTISDLNRDGRVDGADLGDLLSSWGTCLN
jgi:hypothetical protein